MQQTEATAPGRARRRRPASVTVAGGLPGDPGPNPRGDTVGSGCRARPREAAADQSQRQRVQTHLDQSSGQSPVTAPGRGRCAYPAGTTPSRAARLAASATVVWLAAPAVIGRRRPRDQARLCAQTVPVQDSLCPNSTVLDRTRPRRRRQPPTCSRRSEAVLAGGGG